MTGKSAILQAMCLPYEIKSDEEARLYYSACLGSRCIQWWSFYRTVCMFTTACLDHAL